ncbi:putative transcription factor interactor and regulator Znf-B family [Helianthus annuus]|nr:putative transcription factor interactor and regulator Znf-B family [Helianthus annuus]
MATSNNHNPTIPQDTTTPPCDYCNHHIAVIFCRADSAKLCLFCDHIVHSANTLSSKHLRSQICDGCRSAPVSVRCSTDNLVLCRDCDWDAHGSCAVSAAHDRTPIEGFTGTPSPVDLAANWGLELGLDQKKKKNPNDPVLDSGQDSGQWEYPVFDPNSWMQDLMVPDENNNNNNVIGNNNINNNNNITININNNNNNSNDDDDDGGDGGFKFKKLNGSCGKQKNVILKQLSELLKQSMETSEVPRQQGDEDDDDDEGEDEGPLDVELLKDDQSLEQNMMWSSRPRDHRGTQDLSVKVVAFRL